MPQDTTERQTNLDTHTRNTSSRMSSVVLAAAAIIRPGEFIALADEATLRFHFWGQWLLVL